MSNSWRLIVDTSLLCYIIPSISLLFSMPGLPKEGRFEVLKNCLSKRLPCAEESALQRMQSMH